jgi:MFS transporter, ACS family, hexuronate transporter
MVSKKRAGPRNWNLQRRNEHRRNSYAAHCAVDRRTSGVALGISNDRRSGFAWLVLWLWLYRKPEEHSFCSSAEREYIQSDAVEQIRKIKWSQLLPHRQTWAFAAGKFMIDPIWWFCLFWIPDYLQRQHGLHLTQIGLPILVIYVISDLGSIGGGWLSSSLIRRHFSINASRKWAMLICALSVVPVAVVFRVSGLWPATLLIGLAAAGHQGFSAKFLR